MNLSKVKKIKQVCLNVFLTLLSLAFIFPLILIITTSFAEQSSINNFGYTFFPKSFTLDAYEYVFRSGTQILNAYKVTTLLVLVNVPLYLFIRGMTAYALTRAKWGYKFIRFVYISSFFSGGMIPTYILMTQYLHLNDTIWIYIIPGIYSIWDIIIMRTFFRNHPASMIEAAKIDGAREFLIYLKIIIPISLPLYATMAIFSFMGIWNEWYTSMLYVRNEKLYTLGYVLQLILKQATFEAETAEAIAGGANINMSGNEIPEDNIKYAMVIVAAGPAMFIMPFFQKYFKNGLIVGSVKG